MVTRYCSSLEEAVDSGLGVAAVAIVIERGCSEGRMKQNFAELGPQGIAVVVGPHAIVAAVGQVFLAH